MTQNFPNLKVLKASLSEEGAFEDSYGMGWVPHWPANNTHTATSQNTEFSQFKSLEELRVSMPISSVKVDFTTAPKLKYLELNGLYHRYDQNTSLVFSRISDTLQTLKMSCNGLSLVCICNALLHAPNLVHLELLNARPTTSWDYPDDKVR